LEKHVKNCGVHESILGGEMPNTYKIPVLPPNVELDSPAVLKALIPAHRNLAELKGRSAVIPNEGILIDTLSLQEAKASSEIENIVTTQDQIFQISPKAHVFSNPNQKEVAKYRDALHCGFEGLQKQKNILSNNTLISMFQVLKGTTGGFRQTPGTELQNEATGNTIYIPPQSVDEIIRHMSRLEVFINDDKLTDIDPLVKMALIHHQFESIHPFPDGNGRIGRILNVLYLVQQGLLEFPILYLSRYITKNKDEYYHLLQSTRDTGEWEPWLLYMINAVAEIALDTTELISKIRDLMADYKHRIRDQYGFYSQDLLNNLFRHPYTRIEYLMNDLRVSRPTATRYLDDLRKGGFLERYKIGRSVYYMNTPLVALFMEGFDN